MKKDQLINVLEQNGIKYAELPISKEMCILLMERGGRILGLYEKGKDENLFWTAKALESEKEAEELLKSDIWNTGGDRFWFGPEIRYSVTDRKNFWETLHTPEAIDPGTWSMTEKEGSVSFHQHLETEVKDGTGGGVDLEVDRYVYACEDPLREVNDYQELTDGVKFAGYQHRVCSKGSGTCIEGWNLLQVNPTGIIYIPMYVPEKGINYYEPADEFEQITEEGIELKTTGVNRYKTGYKAAFIKGRIGYACKWNGEHCLIVRNFPNDPSGFYEEEPPLIEGQRGFSVHVYNDDGTGGFAEVECSLPATFGKSGREKSDDIISTWVYVGEPEKLQKIAKYLMGVKELKFDF